MASTEAKLYEVLLREDEIALLRDALDSHEYWQLSEEHQRNDGFSLVEDGENEEIDAVRALDSQLAKVQQDIAANANED